MKIIFTFKKCIKAMDSQAKAGQYSQMLINTNPPIMGVKVDESFVNSVCSIRITTSETSTLTLA